MGSAFRPDISNEQGPLRYLLKEDPKRLLAGVLAIRQSRASVPPRIPGEGPVRETAPRIVVSLRSQRPSALISGRWLHPMSLVQCAANTPHLRHRTAGATGHRPDFPMLRPVPANVLVRGSILSPNPAAGSPARSVRGLSERAGSAVVSKSVIHKGTDRPFFDAPGPVQTGGAMHRSAPSFLS